MRYGEYVQQTSRLKFALEELDNLLAARPLKRWAYIVHDEDVHEDGTPIEPHLHVIMEYRSEQTPDNIAKWFNDEPNRIEHAKSKRNAFENMLSYLLHQTDTADGKHQYSPEQVHANFNVAEEIERIRHDVETARATGRKYPIDDKLQAILDGKITRYRIDEYIDGIAQIKYKRQIDYAFEISDRRKAKEVDREMEVMYLCGSSGTGKTTLAKYFAKTKGYDCFITGSSNDPLQGYLGQECIVLDDIRGSDWKMNDLLKILDNNTASLAKSRYSNKLMNDCKLMILTSVQNLDDLYSGIKQGDDPEPIEQLKRRVLTYVVVQRDTLDMYNYDPDSKSYMLLGQTPNPVPMMHFARSNRTLIDELVKAIDDFPLEEETGKQGAPSGARAAVSD